MAPQGAAYHIDWICSNTFDVYVVNSKEWFTSFIEVRTKLGDIYRGPNTDAEVLGIGGVELQIVKSVMPAGKKTFRTIDLRNVLFAPDNIVKIVARAPAQGYYVDLPKQKLLDGIDRSVRTS